MFGFLLLFTFIIIILGLLINSIISAGSFYSSKSSIYKVPKTYLSITFEVLGHVAKADGRVSELEILAAKKIMGFMSLTPEQKKAAIGYFNIGKQPGYNLHSALNSLLILCKNDRSKLETFIEYQTMLAKADGAVIKGQKIILETIYYYLGFIPNFNQKQTTVSSYKLDDAYHTLGLNSHCNEKELKRRYRKLMNDNHPDKLIARGKSEEEVKNATDKTQKIKSAYEIIKKNRKL